MSPPEVQWVYKVLDMSASAIFLKDSGRWLRAEGDRALLDLIEYLYSEFGPWRALQILRERLRLEVAPTAFEVGLIKVAAKRWEVGELPSLLAGGEIFAVDVVNSSAVGAERARLVSLGTENYSKVRGKVFTNLQAAGAWVEVEAGKLVGATDEVEATASDEAPTPRYSRDRAVVAALFDSDWKLIAAARNTNVRVRTRHAEMNLLESLGNDRGSSLIVSTQCCRMCAAAVAERLDVAVFYLQPEPALKHVKTALHGIERQLTVLKHFPEKGHKADLSPMQ
jgi:tRNA(Arg) A34 adenosine deaminase TadA